MEANDRASLERLLGALEWVVQTSTRHRPAAQHPVRLPVGDTLVIYVVAGSIDTSLVGTACHERLDAGDLAVASSCRLGELRATGDAPTEVVVTSLRPAHGSEPHARSFPALLVLRGFATEEPAVAGLAASMGYLEDGRGPYSVGDSSVCAHIATTIVAVALRSWAQRGCAPDDWLLRSHDPHVALALDAIHDEPGRAWTVGTLATVATMSRSVFAERFRTAVGRSPASYLAEVRMSTAMVHLERGELSVGETAALLGYESEAGFSRAFRRHVGMAPSVWRRDRATVAAG